MNAGVTMPADLARQPWERQPREGAIAHSMFVLYRDMGPQRSLKKVTEASGKSDSQIAAWSSKWRWVERAELYEVWMDRQVTDGRAEAIRQMEERHIAAGQGLFVAAMARMQGLKGRGGGLPDVEPLDPSTLADFTDIARVLEASVKIERLTRGMAPDISKALSHIPTAKAESMAILVAETMLPYVLPGREHEAISAVQEALARHFNGPV